MARRCRAPSEWPGGRASHSERSRGTHSDRPHVLGNFLTRKLRFPASIPTIMTDSCQPLHGWKCAMAQQTTVRFIDDLDGSDAVGTVTFSIENRAYEIDL